MDGSHSLLIRSQQFGTQMPQRGHPPHHSITSSARARTVGGISRPSAFAVVRFTMRSTSSVARPEGRRASSRGGFCRHNHRAPEQVGVICPIGDQASRFEVLPVRVHRRDSHGEREGVNPNSVGDRKGVGYDINDHSARARAPQIDVPTVRVRMARRLAGTP